jgi:glycerol kinase
LNDSPLYLVLDQGGHASRALVFNGDGEKVCGSEVPIKTLISGSYIEHDANELVESLREATQQAIEQLGERQVDVISAGLATQRSNMLCWKRSDNEPLSPVISWRDRRAANKLDEINFQYVHKKTGLYANPHYGASKMAWCLEHLPGVTQAANNNDLVMGPMASYLASQLTESTAFADPANASRTMLWNVHTRQWDDDLCDWFGVDKKFLPECVDSDHGFGKLFLSGRSIPLKIVTGDLSAAAFVNGQPREDIAYITLGTGGFIQRIDNIIHDHPQLLDGMIWSSADKQYTSLEGTVNGAGSAISWLAAGYDMDEGTILSELQYWCDTTNDVPLFFNAVSGLGSPAWCAYETPQFSRQANINEKAVAVIESIVFLLYLNMKNMDEVMPEARCIFISGGLSKTDAICQKLSDLSHLPVHRSLEPEGTGRGLTYLLSGSDESWPPKYDLFSPTDSLQIEQRYHDWMTFMRKQSSKDCLYFK